MRLKDIAIPASKSNSISKELNSPIYTAEMRATVANGATIPTYGSEFSAGADLYACIAVGSVVIPAGETAMIGTGISVEIPTGCFGAVFARSGLATKRGLRPANCVGVVDSDYRGEVMVALKNDSDEPQEIFHGDRIAQLVIAPYLKVTFKKVESLTETERGKGGFGSTGIKA